MEQKNPTQLDPKLREVYERVMGTAVPPIQKSAPSQNPIPKPPGSSQSPQTQVFHASPQPKTVTFTNTKSSGSSLAPAYIIGGLLFFMVYAFLWIKIFNLKLPFLP